MYAKMMAGNFSSDSLLSNSGITTRLGPVFWCCGLVRLTGMPDILADTLAVFLAYIWATFWRTFWNHIWVVNFQMPGDSAWAGWSILVHIWYIHISILGWAGAYFRTNIIGIGGIDQHPALWRGIQTGARDRTKLYAHASLQNKYTHILLFRFSIRVGCSGGHQHYGPVLVSDTFAR